MNGRPDPGVLERVRSRLARDAAGHDVGELGRQESRLLVDALALAELDAELSAELGGAGQLEELLAVEGVTDVLVNGPDSVWIDRGSGLERTAVGFASDAEIRLLAVRLSARAGRRLDDASPFVDAALPDGSRLHAILPPLVAHPTLSLRVLSRRRLALPDLVAAGACSDEVADLLSAMVQARLTLLISGGTGSGKTTLLAALLSLVETDQRIVTVEDAAELAIDHPHTVGLVARSANTELMGVVGMSELVRQALRMRVDRLVVGEFRGGEIVDLLTALNTGHAGGAATVHANSVRDVRSRLVALGALGGMSADVLLAQASSALEVLIHVRRGRDNVRRIEQIALWDGRTARIDARSIWTADTGPGPAAPVLRELLVRAAVAVPRLIDGAR